MSSQGTNYNSCRISDSSAYRHEKSSNGGNGGAVEHIGEEAPKSVGESLVIFLALLAGLFNEVPSLSDEDRIGNFSESTDTQAFFKFIIVEAKANQSWYNYNKKKQIRVLKPKRIKNGELGKKNGMKEGVIFKHFADPNEVDVEVIESSNTIIFTVPIPGTTNYVIRRDGKDAGGQQIRLFFTLANLLAGKHADPKLIDFSDSPGKAPTLMMQLIKGSLLIGQTAEIKNGDPENGQAIPYIEKSEEGQPIPEKKINIMLDALRQTTGLNYSVGDRKEGDDSIYYITRHEDKPLPEGEIKINTDIHTADEIVMSLIIRKFSGIKTQPVKITCANKDDYHLSCMVRMGKEFGLSIEDDGYLIDPKDRPVRTVVIY